MSAVLIIVQKIVYNATALLLKLGDITDEDTDAIVNAANSSLAGGGGVDGAIHRKAGEIMNIECAKIRRTEYPEGLPAGMAVMTSGGNLRAKYVIHTVGPVWKGGDKNEESLLSSCIENSLRLAADKNLRKISFPAISTGAYGYPVSLAARTTLNAIKCFIDQNPGKIEEIRVVLFAEKTYNEFENALKNLILQ